MGLEGDDWGELEVGRVTGVGVRSRHGGNTASSSPAKGDRAPLSPPGPFPSDPPSLVAPC